MLGISHGSRLGQPEGSTCAPRAAARSKSVTAGINICFASAPSAQRHHGSIAGPRTLPGTVAVPTLQGHQLRAATHRGDASAGQDSYDTKSFRSNSVKGRKQTSQAAAAAHLERGSSNSPTEAVGNSRPPTGVVSSGANHRTASEVQQNSNNSRSIRPDDQPMQHRQKAQSNTIRQLTSTLKNSKTPQQLLQLAQRHGEQFDHIHIAAAFTHLGQWQSKHHIRAADHQAVQELLQLLERLLSPRTLQRCECRQLSNIIWACSLLYRAHMPLVRTCLGELLAKLGRARSLQDVSNVLYGLAESRAKVPTDQLQQLIAAADRPDLLRMSNPQNISNVIWAVGKMGQQKMPHHQLHRMLAILLSNGTELVPQDVSNTLWGLARMTANVPVLQLQQLEAALVASVGRAKPSEISNTLWACAELLYFPRRLLSALQQQRIWGVLLPSMKSQELANTALAVGTLGHRDEQLMGSILQQAVKVLHQKQQSSNRSVTRQFNVQEMCNLCWAVAVLDLQQYAAEVVYMLVTCSDQWESLQLTELSQIQQVHLWLQDMQQPQAMELQSALNEQLLQQCITAWAARLQQQTEQQSSAFQSQVFRLLQLLPMSWQIGPAMEQLSEPDGMFSIDISAVTADGVRLAVEVDGPTHFRRPDWGLTGNTLYRNRALAVRGYVVISVAIDDWEQLQSQHQQLQYLQQLLQEPWPKSKQKQQLTADRKQHSGSTAAQQAKRQTAQLPAARLSQLAASTQLDEEPTQPLQSPQQQQQQQQLAASTSGIKRVRRVRRKVI